MRTTLNWPACSKDAVAAGVTVVCGAGNGQFRLSLVRWTASSRSAACSPAAAIAQEVLTASNAASAFTSTLYPNRADPGRLRPRRQMDHGDYIVLPVQKGSTYDVTLPGLDGTTNQDGWAFFSGTSSAPPRWPAFVPWCCRRIGAQAGRHQEHPVQDGAGRSERKLAPVDGRLGGRRRRAPTADLATGFGLVDAEAAWKEAKGARVELTDVRDWSGRVRAAAPPPQLDHRHRVVARPVVARDRVEVGRPGDIARRRVAVLQLDQRERRCRRRAPRRGSTAPRSAISPAVKVGTMSGASSAARSLVSTGGLTSKRVGRPRFQPNSAR